MATSSHSSVALASACLDENALSGFACGRLAEEELSRAEHHLASCARCTHALAQLAELEAAPAQGDEAGSLIPTWGSKVGRYVIEGFVGRGGMGAVWAARDLELDRRVAVKLVRADLAEAEGARFLREAKILAQLSHPNVVTLYDAGQFGSQLFIAMELVEGRSLRAELLAEPRGWRAVLSLFLQAGQGLAAVHSAGIVHRDFKPENVLVGRDGRVRITDFGLARATAPEAQQSTIASGASALLSGKDTLAGALAGTPRYMAPEQLAGQGCDARSDQFSFCVSLYEALYGAHPFPEGGGSLIGSPPPGSRVPSWLRRVLLVGLAGDPARRHPSMAELLVALSRDPAAARRRWAVAAAVAVLVIASLPGYRYLIAQRLAACARESWLVGVWDASRREGVRKGLLATGAPFAPATAEGVERTLSRYAEGWNAMRAEICQAQSNGGGGAVLDSRLVCLDERRRELTALVELLSAADAEIATGAVKAAQALSEVGGCTDAAALAHLAPVPPDKRAQIESLRSELAAVQALERVGSPVKALARAEALRGQTAQLGYPPLEAEALLLLGKAHSERDDFKSAESTLREAVVAGERNGLDELVAEACLAAAENSFRQSVKGHAPVWVDLAEAKLGRLGASGELRVRLGVARSELRYVEGDYDAALVEARRAEKLASGLAPEKDLILADVFSILGTTLRDKGSFDEAREYQERALAVSRKALGPEHPLVALKIRSIGHTLFEQRRFEEALQRLREAQQIVSRSLGENVASWALITSDVGAALQQMGRTDEALREFQRSVDSFEKSGTQSPPASRARHNLAKLLAELGRPREALDNELRVIEALEHSLGAEHPSLAFPLSAAGSDYRALGDLPAATDMLERALKHFRELPPSTRGRAETGFALAQVLWDTGRDRARARTLAQDAHDLIEPARASEREAIGRWLSAHPAAGPVR